MYIVTEVHGPLRLRNLAAAAGLWPAARKRPGVGRPRNLRRRWWQYGGLLLIAFQAGDGPRHLDFAYGHEIDLDAYLLPPERITELLRQAGLVVEAQLLREPDDRYEKTRQAFLLARKPARL